MGKCEHMMDGIKGGKEKKEGNNGKEKK